MLKDKDYGWTRESDDRVVIFTERIETMKYLAARLREDLGLPANGIQEISGAMSDGEQQMIVENFGREEAPVRILVASDVASEGLNLHYLSHRMIHFDIPWSLMVFQQRNGRIDRYGQQKRPDIRYMMIESDNPRIKGDMRIMEILITKEEQALKNIGDPAMLLGKFSIEDEELVILDTIENGSDADAFSEALDSGEEEFDPFEALMAASADTWEPASVKTDETLFSDVDYLYLAMSYLNQSESHPVEKLQSVSGIEVTITPDMRKRLTALLPDEAMPKGDYLRLSDDKEFCMSEMKRSMQNNLAETAWPKVQYLWKQHPLFTWVNDKGGLLYGRGEAPIVGIPDKMRQSETIFVITGSIPNARSTPLVDEWFALCYENGNYTKSWSMEEMLKRTEFRSTNIPNSVNLTETDVKEAEALLPDVVLHAKVYLDEYYQNYQKRIGPLLDEELDKLAELETRHKDYQLSLFENERKRNEQERMVDELFDKFTTWVTETMSIQNNPYIRIIAVMKGVAR